MSRYDDANDFLMSGGARAATLKVVGDWVEGIIVAQPELRQQTDFQTRQPKTWRDGNPAMEVRVLLQTEQRDLDDPEGDDGIRAIYIRGDLQRAVREAVREAAAPGLQVGGKLRVVHTALGQPKSAGMNPPKLYGAKYRAPDPDAVPVPAPSSAADVAYDDDIPF